MHHFSKAVSVLHNSLQDFNPENIATNKILLLLMFYYLTYYFIIFIHHSRKTNYIKRTSTKNVFLLQNGFFSFSNEKK